MIAEKTMSNDEVEAYREIFGGPPPVERNHFGYFEFDLFAFDDFLHKRLGYDEDEHGSIKDFLVLKYGDPAANLVHGMIGSVLDPKDWGTK